MEVVHLDEGFMVDHPAGAHYALLNGPAFLDIGIPGGDFVRFPVAGLTSQWALLQDPTGQPLPVSARMDGNGVWVMWWPFRGPGLHAPSTAPGQGAPTDADYARALQNISSARHRAAMDAAMAIGGWHRKP